MLRRGGLGSQAFFVHGPCLPHDPPDPRAVAHGDRAAWPRRSQQAIDQGATKAAEGRIFQAMTSGQDASQPTAARLLAWAAGTGLVGIVLMGLVTLVLSWMGNNDSGLDGMAVIATMGWPAAEALRTRPARRWQAVVTAAAVGLLVSGVLKDSGESLFHARWIVESIAVYAGALAAMGAFCSVSRPQAEHLG
jgi:hypothetical protein